MGNLYSIGHSTHPVELLLYLLRMYEINYLLDVRSIPYSRYVEEYNRERFSDVLAKNGIKYWYMGKYFGARQEDISLYTQEKYLDFEKVRKSASFQNGIENVLKGLRDNNIAMMCTEKNPMDCHRAIMVGKGFMDAGVEVKHILPDGSYLTQSDLERQMLNKYFPEYNQLSLFQEENRSEKYYVEECYRIRNREIGYSIAGEDN